MTDYQIRPKMLEDGHLEMDVYRAFSLDNKAETSQLFSI